MKIEIGKVYVCRRGTKVRILAEHEGAYIGLLRRNKDGGPVAEIWDEDGNVYSKNVPCDYDIVGLYYEDPKVDWDSIPDYIRYVAMDTRGQWFGFVMKPHFIMDGPYGFWSIGRQGIYDGFCWHLQNCDTPAFSGSFKDSLCVRPGHEKVDDDMNLDTEDVNGD